MEQGDMEHMFRIPTIQKSTVPDSQKILTYGFTIYSSGTEISILVHHITPQKILACAGFLYPHASFLKKEIANKVYHM
jgi:hypothetical protein